MAHYLACGNTAAFTSSHCQYHEVTTRFNTQGKLVERIAQPSQCGGGDFSPWLCDVCGSDNVEVPDDVEVA